MRLLALISWPYVRRRILRTLLTVAGIVLGVAVFVGMHTANQSVLFAFNRTVDAETAQEVAKLFVEAIAAPDYSPEALAMLQSKKNLRLMRVAPGSEPLVTTFLEVRPSVSIGSS